MQPRQRNNQISYKPTPRNLRYFCSTPYARRAINAYKNTICQLDWEIVVKPGWDVSDELIRQMMIVQFCFEHPNDDDNFSQFLEQVVEDMMVGAGAIEQEIGGNPERPLWMWPVDGLSIQIYPLWAGNPDEARYAQMLGYGTASGASVAAQLRNDQLIYIRPNPSTATPFGLGPIEIAFNSISRQLGVSAYAGNITSNATPGGFIHLGDVSDDHIRSFRQYWKNDIEGQGKTPITGGGDKPPSYISLHPEGDTALYLKYQDFLKREIAIACDLSPQNLGIESDINRNTAEVAEDRDIAQAIGPFGRKIAKSLTKEAINQRLGFYGLEFRFKGLDREDEIEEANVYDKEYKNNATTPNEYRLRRGRPRTENPWGDLLFADFQIAQQAARGAQALADTEKGLYDDGPSNANVQNTSTQKDRIGTTDPSRPTPTKGRGSSLNKTMMPSKKK
jgi:hypothetical protein